MFSNDMKKLYQTIRIDRKSNSFRSYIVLLCYRLQHYCYIKNYKALLHVVGGAKI